MRVITVDNATDSNEHIGIDDIDITTGSGASPLSLTNPGAQTSTVGHAITPFNLVATGGTTPLHVRRRPTCRTAYRSAQHGVISGTPTTAGSPSPSP